MLTGATATAIPGALPPISGVGPTVIHSVETSPVSQKDTTYTKIFVGGLPYHTTDKSLREHFEVYGEIEEAVVITDRQTGKSRGYGFVTMVDRASAERATKDPNPAIDGRKANVNLAYLGAKPRGPVSTTEKFSDTTFPYTNGLGGFTTAAVSPAALRLYPHLAAAGASPYGLAAPAGYLHYSPYLQPAHIPLVPTHHQLNPSAAAAYSTAFADAAYLSAAYPGAAHAGADPYAAAAAAAAASGIPAYNYGTAAGLPQVAASVAAGSPGTIPLAAYTAAPQPQIQEARLQ